MKVICKMGSGICLPVRLNDLSLLGLDKTVEIAISKIQNNNKMDWELWIESASNYTSLKASLAKRGYTGFEPSDKAEILIPADTRLRLDRLPNQKTMLRRASKS